MLCRVPVAFTAHHAPVPGEHHGRVFLHTADSRQHGMVLVLRLVPVRGGLWGHDGGASVVRLGPYLAVASPDVAPAVSQGIAELLHQVSSFDNQTASPPL